MPSLSSFPPVHAPAAAATRMNGWRAAIIGLTALLCAGCAAVEVAGRVYRGAGQAMSDYSKEKGNDGFVAQAAGLGGQVSTAVGGVLEDAATDRSGGSTKEGPARRLSTTNATLQPVATIQSAPSMSIADAQRRLAELGYQPGPADGSLGKRTATALANSQGSVGLPTTGKLDAGTAEALRSARR